MFKDMLFLARIVLIFFMIPVMGLWFDSWKHIIHVYAENSVDNTGMFFLVLRSSHKESLLHCKDAGRDTAERSDPGWPQRCSIWYHAQHIELWEEGGKGRTFRVMAFAFPNPHSTWLSPVFLEMAKHPPANGK